MLEARDLACVRGLRPLFAHVRFSMAPGDCCGLTRPNGRGKTSLLRVLCGLLPAACGDVLWNGEPIAARRRDYAAAVTYIGHRAAVKPELTAIENLRVSSALCGWDVTAREARTALERVGLGGHEHVH